MSPPLLAQDTGEPAISLISFVVAGGVVGYLIIALSLGALALVVTHLLQIRRSALAPPELLDELDARLGADRPDVAGALAICQEPANRCFTTRVLGAGLTRVAHSPLGGLELRTAMEETASSEVARLYRSTDALALIAAIAPMLGLLGTVVGINAAFGTIAAVEGVARQDQLAGDISLALTTTIMGLILAIPATAAVTFFRNRIDGLAQEVGNRVEALAAPLETPTDA